MKKTFIFLLALVIALSVSLVAAMPVAADPGTTYYVSTTGSDEMGDGSYSDPWRTIQQAVGQVASGDTIMVAVGEYEAFQVQGKTNISILSAEGATVTTANCFTVDIGPIVGDVWVMAAVNASENINIEGINFDGTELSEEENVCGIAYLDSTGSIADLTVANIIGTGWDLGGVAIIGDVGTSVVDLSGVTVQNSLAGVAIFNSEANLDGCTITETGIGILIGWPLDGFDPSTVNIQGSTIADNYDVGIWVCDDSTVEAHFNNIVDNSEIGVEGGGIVTVDATRNWWGDASGPYHESLNPDGMGNGISGNVDFEPWLEAEVVAAKTETVTGGGTVNAKEEADTEVEVTGNATVTVARYDENPGGDAPTDFNALDKYIDVYIPDTTEVTEIEIRLYYTDAEVEAADVDEDSLRLLWWNGTLWVQFSPDTASGVNTDSIYGYSGYMWATITEDTTPSLANLQGTEFGAYEGPSQVPSGGCFIATAAYGTDTAGELDILREFRDAVLLPNSLGARFVSLYYKTSPPLANFISQSAVLRTVVRVGFVDPIVKIITWSHDLWST
jgi:hypothetical protein